MLDIKRIKVQIEENETLSGQSQHSARLLLKLLEEVQERVANLEEKLKKCK